MQEARGGSEEMNSLEQAGQEQGWKPDISVVVPAYNAERFLTRAVDSIRRQTMKNIEILLVDDGSTDGTAALCRSLAAEDSRIRVLTRQNGGAAAARNTGIRAASGQYVCFVDADDYIEPDFCENLLDAARRTAAAGDHAPDRFLVQAGRDEVDEKLRPLAADLPLPEKTYFVSSHDFIEGLLLYTSDSSYCTKLVPRKLLLAHPFPEGETGEDFVLHLQMLPDIDGVLLIPKPGYHVVHREGSVTRGKHVFSRAYEDVVRHADLVERTIVPRYPDLARQAVRFGLYVRLDYMLHVPVDDMRRDNAFYRHVIRYLRSHAGERRRSPYLTARDKRELLLLTWAPVLTRRLHRLSMRLRGNCP